MAIGKRNALIGMGHVHNKTEVIIDNSTANSFVHSEMRVKRSKSWDMKYNWLRDRMAQQQFHIKWDKGIYNMANCFTNTILRPIIKLRGTNIFLKNSSHFAN